MTRGCTTLVVLLAVGAGWSCGPDHPAPEEDHHSDDHGPREQAAGGGRDREGVLQVDPSLLRDLRLTTATVVRRSAGETIVALGEARPNVSRYGEVGSPVPARVTALLAEPGSSVRKQTPLVELESVEVGRARAELGAAEARLALAEQTLERRRGLASDRIVPARELQQAEADQSSAVAAVRALRGAARSMGAARGAGGRFRLSAPVDGVVLERNAVLGEMVDPSDVLYRVGDLSVLWVVVHSFERDALRVREGRAARVSFPGLPGRTFEGPVVRVGRRVDTVSRTIEVQIDIENADGLLRPGMSASASIPVGDEGSAILAVPSIALQRLAGGWCVFVPRGPGSFEVRSVGRGRDLGEDAEVLRGLTEGESVVVEGAFLLKAEVERSRGGGGDEHGH